MVIAIRTSSRRRVALAHRDWLALKSMDRLKIRNLTSNISTLCSILNLVKNRRPELRLPLARFLVAEFMDLLSILVVDVPVAQPRIRYPPMNFVLMNEKLISLGLSWSQRFRFQSMQQMEKIKINFRLPDVIIVRG